MKSITPKLTALALLPAALLTFASCSTTSETSGGVDAAVISDYEKGVPGGVLVETYKTTVTVTAIDRASRKVTLIDKDATLMTYTAGPEVANFDQLRVGDQVKATATGRIVVQVHPPGELAASGDAAAALVSYAPIGEKPGGTMATTEEVTAKVQAIDAKHHTATLQFPDGSRKVYKVRKDVDLTKQALGSDVVIRVTQAVAISVEKP